MFTQNHFGNQGQAAPTTSTSIFGTQPSTLGNVGNVSNVSTLPGMNINPSGGTLWGNSTFSFGGDQKGGQFKPQTTTGIFNTGAPQTTLPSSNSTTGIFGGGTGIFNQPAPTNIMPIQQAGFQQGGIQNQPGSGGLFPLHSQGGMQTSSNPLSSGIFKNISGSTSQSGTSSGLFNQNPAPFQTSQTQPNIGLGQNFSFGNVSNIGTFNTMSNMNLGNQNTLTTMNQGNNLLGMNTTQKGSHMIAYVPFKAKENSNNTNDKQKVDTIQIMTITAMQEFSLKSIEELRYEDYINKKNGLVYNKANLIGVNQNTGWGTSINFSQPRIGAVGVSIGGSGESLFGGQPSSTFGNIFQNPTANQNKAPGNVVNFFGQQQNLQSQNIQQNTSQLFSQPAQSGILGQSNLFSQQTAINPQTQSGGLFPGFTTTNLPTFGNTNANQNPSQFNIGNTSTPPTVLFQGGDQKASLFNTPKQGSSQGQLNIGSQQSSLFSSSMTQPQGNQMGIGLFGNTQTTNGQGLLNKPQEQGGLFQSLSNTNPVSQGLTQGNTQTGLNLNLGQKGTQNLGGLFQSGNSQLNFSQMQNSVPGTCNGVNPYSGQQNEIISNYIYGKAESRTIGDILNDIQKQYLEQDFLFSDEATKGRSERRTDINLGESKYSFFSCGKKENNLNPYTYNDPKSDLGLLNNFLKSKRTYQNPYQEKEITKQEEIKAQKNKKLLDFDLQPQKSDTFSKEEDDFKLTKKSHSCDLIKKNERIIVNNLEKSFIQKINIEEDSERKTRTKKKLENVYLDLHIAIQEPIKLSFSLKIDKYSKLSVLKACIADNLRERHPKFKKIHVNSFVLMKKYSILKDSSTLMESDIKDGDIIYILLKESFNTAKDQANEDNLQGSTRKESRADKKKKKKKNELAPVEKLPLLTKQGYKTNPDLKTIYRMSREELENVENFSISNEYGKIEFDGKTDLTGLNLDQIVTIEKGNVQLYKIGNMELLPEPGQGLNKQATIHLFGISDVSSLNAENEEFGIEDSDFASLKKKCKAVKVKKTNIIHPFIGRI